MEHPIDHDRNFKLLFTTFFQDFVALFLPETAAYLDLDTPIEFLDKEILTDLTEGEEHVVDLI